MTPAQRDALLSTEERRISTLRMQMLELHPFWGYLLLHMKVIAAPALETIAATDCSRTIWYNPLRTQHLSLRQLGFVLAHEVGHQLFASVARSRGRGAPLWNCATDFAINRIVADIDHPARPGEKLYQAPDGILLDPRWDGMIAEAIYEYLAAETLPEPVSLTLTLELSTEDGSTTTLRVPNVTDHGGGIDVHLPGELCAADRDELVERLGAAVRSGLGGASRGDIPGVALRRLELTRRPRVPWQAVFRSYIGQAVARDDYSLRNPNRRYLEHDLVVPGLHADKTGTVVVAVDTSASMSQAELSAVASELEHIADLVEDMTLLVADSQVRQVVPMGGVTAFLREARFKGGGGTDHRPVFAWLTERRLYPDVFVGLTDLESRFPARRPPFPVLWVAPERHGDAPWGRVIELAG